MDREPRARLPAAIRSMLRPRARAAPRPARYRRLPPRCARVFASSIASARWAARRFPAARDRRTPSACAVEPSRGATRGSFPTSPDARAAHARWSRDDASRNDTSSAVTWLSTSFSGEVMEIVPDVPMPASAEIRPPDTPFDEIGRLERIPTAPSWGMTPSARDRDRAARAVLRLGENRAAAFEHEQIGAAIEMFPPSPLHARRHAASVPQHDQVVRRDRDVPLAPSPGAGPSFANAVISAPESRTCVRRDRDRARGAGARAFERRARARCCSRAGCRRSRAAAHRRRGQIAAGARAARGRRDPAAVRDLEQRVWTLIVPALPTVRSLRERAQGARTSSSAAARDQDRVARAHVDVSAVPGRGGLAGVGATARSCCCRSATCPGSRAFRRRRRCRRRSPSRSSGR